MSRVKIPIGKALKDTPLTAAVLKSCDLSNSKREKVVGELDDFEKVREEARTIREFSLDNLDFLLDAFTASFTDAGGHVHNASDANEACGIILDLLARRKAVSGVKSKSMVAEEIGLGKALEANRIDSIESDLGEFIVQLAGEPPSHITAPALHRSRQSIGKLLSQKLKFPYTDDPAKLTRAARGHLRRRFLSAQFGLSGANFVVAESGHLVLVENEGNGRMGYSLPPIYIAITGIEKVIEKIADLAPLLRLLARSATGQRFTTYTSFIKPTRTGEDGPQEMHVVLVDNGRRKALADAELREMLLCIRCGACLNACPVYKSVGGHAYDSIYPGPMGAIWSNIAGEPDPAKMELADLSTLCGACRDICPISIDIPRMLLELRGRREKGIIEAGMAEAWKWTMSSKGHYEAAGKVGRGLGMMLPNGLAGGWLDRGGPAFRDEMPETPENEDE